MNRSLLTVCLALALSNLFGQAGTLEPTFHSLASGPCDAVAVQPDGRVLLGGTVFEFAESDTWPGMYPWPKGMTRLFADGSMDSSFHASFAVGSQVKAIVLLPNGQIMAGGHFQMVNNIPCNNIIRLNPDGRPDTSFQTLPPEIVAEADEIRSIALLPDGKLMVGGSFSEFNGLPRANLTRVLPTGAVDPDFQIGLGTNGPVNCFLPQSGGQLLVGGSFNHYNTEWVSRVIRLQADGTLDGSFAESIINGVETDLYGHVLCLAAHPDGGIWVGGELHYSPEDYVGPLVLLSANGDFVQSEDISAAGLDGNFPASVRSMTTSASGKLLIGGHFRYVDTEHTPYLARLYEDGSADEDFETGDGPSKTVNALALAQDNKLVIAGRFTSYDGDFTRSVARLNLCTVAEPCDDGDECTITDTYLMDCFCIGTALPDADGDGLCDAQDGCPSDPLTESVMKIRFHAA